LEALKRLDLPYQATNNGRDLAYSIPQTIQRLHFNATDYGSLNWLKALPASAHRFPRLQLLTLDISEFYLGRLSIYHTWTSSARRVCRDTINEFMTTSRGADTWLIILYKEQKFDMASILNLECIKAV
jgi:hypothetical protein